MVRATAVVHKHEPRRRVELPPRSRWFDSVPVPFFSFSHVRQRMEPRACRWVARFRRQNPHRKSIRGRKLAPFAETGFLVSARYGEGWQEVQAVPCASQVEGRGERGGRKREREREGEGEREELD